MFFVKNKKANMATGNETATVVIADSRFSILPKTSNFLKRD